MKRGVVVGALLALGPVIACADEPVSTPIQYNRFGSPCPYPQSARSAHSEGTVYVSYRGTDDGRVVDVVISRTSGYADLDDATVACVSHWRFEPSTAADRLDIGQHRIGISWTIPAAGEPLGRFVGLPHTCFRYYPEAEERAGIEGKARVTFTITADGDVRDPAIGTSSGNANLDAAALQCVQGWRYRPAVQNGKPVSVPWAADIEWKVEVPQPPPLAEPRRDCLHSYPVRASDLAGIDGTTEVTFDIIRGEVKDARVTHSSGNAALDRAAVDCVASRRYVRETVAINGVAVDKFRSLTVRERVSWPDALKTGK